MLTQHRWPFFETPRFIPQPEREAFAPAVDITEENDSLVVRAELAGVKGDDVHIELENNVLTLRGEKRSEHTETKDGVHRVERWSGSFARQFVLPKGVEADKIDAAMKDGVLTVRIPKKAEPKSQRIAVKVD
jgi:HSP20 family protein